MAQREAVTVLQDCRAINVILQWSAEGGLKGYLQCGLDPKGVVVAGFGLSWGQREGSAHARRIAEDECGNVSGVCGHPVRRSVVSALSCQWCPDLRAIASLFVEGTCSKE